MPHLLIFSNDPLKAYLEKGEIKPRYYNPCNLFDRVTICTPCDEDVRASEVKDIAGSAELNIIPIGSMKRVNRIMGWKSAVDNVISLARDIAPDVIRAFNPRFEGLFAVESARAIGIPSAISLHGDFSRARIFRVEGLSNPKSLLYSFVFLTLTEKRSIEQADVVISAYRFPLRYFKGKNIKRVEIVYNKVYGDSSDGVKRIEKLNKFTIISVGRHIPGKDPKNLIRAMCDVNGELVLIGSGPLTAASKDEAIKMKVASKVHFVSSVPNREIMDWYRKCHVYSMAMLYGGISIPMLEAMSCSLPLVMAKPYWEQYPEIIEDDCVIVENNPESFAEAFRRLQGDPSLVDMLGAKSFERYYPIRGEVMEKREADIYRSLMEKTK